MVSLFLLSLPITLQALDIFTRKALLSNYNSLVQPELLLILVLLMMRQIARHAQLVTHAPLVLHLQQNKYVPLDTTVPQVQWILDSILNLVDNIMLLVFQLLIVPLDSTVLLGPQNHIHAQ
jgi:hypothetical protein